MNVPRNKIPLSKTLEVPALGRIHPNLIRNVLILLQNVEIRTADACSKNVSRLIR